MDDYVNSTYIEKKYYIWKQYFSKNFGNIKISKYGLKEILLNRYTKFRQSNFSEFKTNPINSIRIGIRKKFRKFILYITAFIIIYYGIKYLFFRLRNRSQDKKLEEALTLVKALKTQNEELIKNNQELIAKVKYN